MELENFSKKRKYEEYMELLKELEEIKRKTKLNLGVVEFELESAGLKISWKNPTMRSVTLDKEKMERLIKYIKELAD